jgi:dipeptide transport system ATP-binding protein
MSVAPAPASALTAATTAPHGGPLLVAHGVSKEYRVRRGMFGGSVVLHAVAGATFELMTGRTLAVVGESGCGKSTLARMVTMIEPPTSGELRLEGVDLVAAGAAERRRLRPLVQMVFQNPYGSLNPRQKVGTTLEEPLRINTAMPAEERRAAAHAMMQKVGLRPEHYNRYPHMFSGGQRQRIAIARALMLRPRILVADEPVSALDVSVRAQVLNLLMDLQEEFHLATMFISHDLSVVRHIADEVMVMYLGRPVEHGPKEAIFTRQRHPYTLALLASTPMVDAKVRRIRAAVRGELPSPFNPPPGCAFHRRCAYAQERCSRDRPELRLVDGRRVACHYAETVGETPLSA